MMTRFTMAIIDQLLQVLARAWSITSIALLAFLLSAAAHAQTTVEYIHTDALGSPVAVTNASGNVIEREVYEPYGSPITRPPSDQPGFTGHVADSLTGLTYMQQRYYDPQVGRFLSVDPVTAYSNPVGAFNRYWYANNNPYRFSDPDGRAAVITYKADGTISVQIPISYSGPGATAANTAALASDTSSAWSGSYSVGGSSTTVNVSVVGVDASTPAAAINNITLLNGPTSDVPSMGASFVNAVGGTSGEWNMMSPGMGNGEGPHEMGHLMGAQDRYSSGIDASGNRTTTPTTGYSGNIMGELRGTPDSRTINEILNHPSNVVVREPPPSEGGR